MAALTPAQLAALVRAHFPAAGQVTAYAIARAESGGRPDAIGDAGQSFGLWQIYRPAHPQYGAAWLLNPDNNAIAATAISGGGTNWNPWCSWERSACGGAGNASYRRFLAEATAALAPAPLPTPDPTPAPARTDGIWIAALLGGGVLLYAAGAIGGTGGTAPTAGA